MNETIDFTDKRIWEAALPNRADENDDTWTKAEIKETERNNTARTLAKHEHKANIRENPRLAFKGIFKADYWAGGYANFPVAILAALPFQSTPFVRSNTKKRRDQRNEGKRRLCRFIRSYALMNLARKIYDQTETDVMSLPQPAKLPAGYDAADQRHRAIGAAMFLMDREGGTLERFKQRWRLGEEHLVNHQLVHKEQARVQISLALLGQQHDYLTERDLRVLMAVNSCCGQKGWHQINWQMIAMRAVGATSAAMLARFEVEPLSRKQVERALDKLRKRGLIRLYVWRKRISFVAKRGKGCLSEANFQDIVSGEVKRRHEKKHAVEDSIVATTKRGEVIFTTPDELDGDTDDW